MEGQKGFIFSEFMRKKLKNPFKAKECSSGSFRQVVLLVTIEIGLEHAPFVVWV